MFAFFKRLLGIAEVDLSNILASFHRTVADLEAHVDFHRAVAKAKEEEAKLATKLAADASAAAAKATGIAYNIRLLLNEHTPSL
jgi:hypothetical protein